MGEWTHLLARSLVLLAGVSLILSVALIMGHKPVIAFIYGRGAFHVKSVALTGQILPYFSLGIIPEVLSLSFTAPCCH